MLAPFEEDRLALARQDFCIAAENVSRDETLLSCTLGTRSCGSYIAATKDVRMAAAATEPLLRSVAPFRLTGWMGGSNDQRLDAAGGCQCLGADDAYREILWETLGYNAVANSAMGTRQAIDGHGSIVPRVPLEQYRIAAPAFGSPAYMLSKYLRSTRLHPLPAA